MSKKTLIFIFLFVVASITILTVFNKEVQQASYAFYINSELFIPESDLVYNEKSGELLLLENKYTLDYYKEKLFEIPISGSEFRITKDDVTIQKGVIWNFLSSTTPPSGVPVIYNILDQEGKLKIKFYDF